jgi:deoxyribose-phosphate aldolase
MAAASTDELLSMLDFTLLDESATADALRTFFKRAVDSGVGAVCVMPCHVAQARAALPPSIVVACTPGGFPIPYDDEEARAKEVAQCVRDGAGEVRHRRLVW